MSRRRGPHPDSSLGKRVIYVTNNSTEARVKQSNRLKEMGINAREDQIFTSAYSTAVYISQILKLQRPKDKIFVLGDTGIEAELASVGLRSIGGTAVAYRRSVTMKDLEDIASGAAIDEEVGAVVVGMDSGVNYLKLCYATHYIRKGAVYLATNTDASFPVDGAIFPAAGCISGALKPIVGKDPLLMGKPSTAMMDSIKARYELDLGRTCIIGDSLETDIRFGNEAGLGGTLLVLSGICGKEDAQNSQSDNLPSAYVEKLSDLLLCS